MLCCFDTFNFIIIVSILWNERRNHEYTDNCIIFIIHCGSYFQFFFLSQNVVAGLFLGSLTFLVLLDFNGRRLPNFNFNLRRLAPFIFLCFFPSFFSLNPRNGCFLSGVLLLTRHRTCIVFNLNIAFG